MFSALPVICLFALKAIIISVASEDILMAAVAAAPDYKGTEPGISRRKEQRPPWSAEEGGGGASGSRPSKSSCTFTLLILTLLNPWNGVAAESDTLTPGDHSTRSPHPTPTPTTRAATSQLNSACDPCGTLRSF